MKAQSLGYRTHLMICELEGSLVQDRGDYLVIRSPASPDYWWGNFLLVPPPAPGDLMSWTRRFRQEFPGAGHVAIGVDTADAIVPDAAELAAARLDLDQCHRVLHRPAAHVGRP